MDVRFAGTRFLAGSVVALLAAVSLVRWGAAPFRVMGEALVWRVGEPLPVALQHSGAGAACSLLFGVATLLALLGLFQLTRMAAFSSLALILLISSGAASATGGVGLCMAAARQAASLQVIARSETAATEAQVAAAVEYARTPAQWGFAGLLAGAALLVVLSCGSLKHCGRVVPARRSARIAGTLAAGCLMGFALLLATAWFPLHSLAVRFGASGPARPSDLAGLISQTIQWSLLAAGSLIGYGVLLVLFGILLRQATR